MIKPRFHLVSDGSRPDRKREQFGAHIQRRSRNGFQWQLPNQSLPVGSVLSLSSTTR